MDVQGCGSVPSTRPLAVDANEPRCRYQVPMCREEGESPRLFSSLDTDNYRKRSLQLQMDAILPQQPYNRLNGIEVLRSVLNDGFPLHRTRVVPSPNPCRTALPASAESEYQSPNPEKPESPHRPPCRAFSRAFN